LTHFQSSRGPEAPGELKNYSSSSNRSMARKRMRGDDQHALRK
jgi:hypothetical protein